MNNITTTNKNTFKVFEVNETQKDQLKADLYKSKPEHKENKKNKPTISATNAILSIGSAGIIATSTKIGKNIGENNYKKEKLATLESLQNEIKKINNKIYSSETADLIDQLEKALINKIKEEKQGRERSFHNSIALIGSDRKLNKKIINWMGSSPDINFETFKGYDPTDIRESMYNFVCKLDDIKDQGKKTKQRTLFFAEYFDEMANPQKNFPDNIDDLKERMCNLGDEFKTTLIFDTNKFEEIDDAIRQPHRIFPVIQINAPKLEIEEFLKGEETKIKLLKQIKNIDKLPKTAISKGIILGILTGTSLASTIILTKHLYEKYQRKGKN